MVTVLDTELATWAEHRDRLLCEAEGRWVLIHGSEVVGVYDGQMEAIAEGRRRFGMVPILVREIVQVEERATFSANILAI